MVGQSVIASPVAARSRSAALNSPMSSAPTARVYTDARPTVAGNHYRTAASV